MKQLNAKWGGRVQFLDVLVRQAHPGPGVEAYQSFAQKAADARRHKHEHGIPWPVLVDNLAGTVHQVYSGLADPIFLIDIDGRVSFVNMWAHAPNLDRAIDALFAQDGRGVVLDGIDHLIHMLPPFTDGWRGIERGLPRSYVDLETSFPLMASSLWLGYRLKPLLAPLTLRAERLSPPARAATVAGALLLTLAAARALADD